MLKVKLEIAGNTLALNSDGPALESINVKINSPLTGLDDGSILIYSLECSPDGSTFSPPASLTLQYDTSLIPEGINESDLQICWYDIHNNAWTEVESRVDSENHAITASIDHFSTYALVAPVTPGIGWSIFAFIVLAELVIAALVFFYIYRRRKSRVYTFEFSGVRLLSTDLSSEQSMQPEKKLLPQPDICPEDLTSLNNIRCYLISRTQGIFVREEESSQGEINKTDKNINLGRWSRWYRIYPRR